MAEHALGFFGYQDRIIDNALEPEDRNLFYMFEDYNLFTTESEETTLWDGRDWRIHYWKFKPELSKLKGDNEWSGSLYDDQATDGVYEDLFSSDIWTRRVDEE
jgi:hypothetical protein